MLMVEFSLKDLEPFGFLLCTCSIGLSLIPTGTSWKTKEMSWLNKWVQNRISCAHVFSFLANSYLHTFCRCSWSGCTQPDSNTWNPRLGPNTWWFGRYRDPVSTDLSLWRQKTAVHKPSMIEDFAKTNKTKQKKRMRRIVSERERASYLRN